VVALATYAEPDDVAARWRDPWLALARRLRGERAGSL